MDVSKAAGGSHIWFWAERQTHGKGRSGRQWASEQGNLYASLLLELDCDIGTVSQLSLLAGVAAYDALAKSCSTTVTNQLCLKWPNDLLIDGAKVGGILLESSQNADKDKVTVVIGTGINLKTHPNLPDRRTVSLAARNQTVSSETALLSLAKSTAEWLQIWDMGRNFEQIREAWMLRGQKNGTPIKVKSGSAVIEGHFAGLNFTGGMILQLPSGEYKDIHFGDVMLIGEEKKKG